MTKPDTIHFNVGNIGSTGTPSVPGSFNPAAAAFFGQLNIATTRVISVCHIHLLVDGAVGQALNIEVYKAPKPQGPFSLLTAMSWTSRAQSFPVVVAGVPANPVIEKGYYLFAQCVQGTTANPGQGLTVDVHFQDQ